MKAMQVVPGKNGPMLRAADIPRPVLQKGEVLVRVVAAGVTPSELSWYPTTHTAAGGERTLAIPGHEFSGVVAEVGAGVTEFAAGQAVFGMNDWFAEGATAEYCVTKPEWIAAKPAELTHEAAAALPIGALTAWQGLFDRAKVKVGDRVLVHGGSGAVGLFAVQLAKLHGATVIATASAANKELVAGLGASRVIDYRSERFEELAGAVDIVFDTVGGETLERSWPLLASGGRMVTVAATGEAVNEQRVKDAFFIVEANREQLEAIAELLTSGALRTFVNAVVPFEQAAKAYANATEKKLGYGKVVLSVDQSF